MDKITITLSEVGEFWMFFDDVFNCLSSWFNGRVDYVHDTVFGQVVDLLYSSTVHGQHFFEGVGWVDVDTNGIVVVFAVTMNVYVNIKFLQNIKITEQLFSQEKSC